MVIVNKPILFGRIPSDDHVHANAQEGTASFLYNGPLSLLNKYPLLEDFVAEYSVPAEFVPQKDSFVSDTQISRGSKQSQKSDSKTPNKIMETRAQQSRIRSSRSPKIQTHAINPEKQFFYKGPKALLDKYPALERLKHKDSFVSGTRDSRQPQSSERKTPNKKKSGTRQFRVSSPYPLRIQVRATNPHRSSNTQRPGGSRRTQESTFKMPKTKVRTQQSLSRSKVRVRVTNPHRSSNTQRPGGSRRTQENIFRMPKTKVGTQQSLYQSPNVQVYAIDPRNNTSFTYKGPPPLWDKYPLLENFSSSFKVEPPGGSLSENDLYASFVNFFKTLYSY